jgi:hypothetical protein
MTNDRSADTTAPARARRELWIASVFVTMLLLVPLIVPSLRPLFTRPLWLDELHTWLLARELPSSRLVWQLEHGADFNPPLLHVVDSLLLHLLPALPAQLVLRLTSVLAVAGSVVLLYRIFRQRLGATASAAGALAPLAHSTLLSQLHEARFYAPWMFLTIAVAWALQGVVDHPRSRARFAVLVLLTAATCLIHYFGIISLACLALGVIVKLRAPARLGRPMLGLALGTAALAAWLPVYAAQRHVLSVPTWIPAPTVQSSLDLVRAFLAYPPFLLVLAAAIVFVALRRTPHAPTPEPSVAQAALLGLLALPIALVVFSLVVQPALIARYALPAVAGASCVVALATARLPRPVPALVVLAILATHGALELRRARLARAFSHGVTTAVAAVNFVADDPRPVVSLDRFSLYPAALSAANRNARLAYLVVPPDSFRAYRGPMRNETAEFNIVERDATVAHHAVFGFPTLISLEALRATPSFFMLLPDSAATPPFPLLFRDRMGCRVQERLLLFGATRGGGAADTVIAACRKRLP